MAETISRVHHGFKVEVDELWPFVSANLIRWTKAVNKELMVLWT